ncbi:MAG: 2-keto-3-deoxy-galactonokinase [Mucilaginibacter sp.]|nr:2-keto-3-deoxy-galactonokinase [Mucilaginibacter sp.]
MKQFLSCDWGTSSFRLRLVDVNGFQILAEETDSNGIAAIFALWKQNDKPEEERCSFYLDVINKYIEKIESKTGSSLNGVQLIISGMASSTMGFVEIPYSELPVGTDGINIKTLSISADQHFAHDVMVISGLRSADDVVRGEETQLIGCIDPSHGKIDDELFIFPGTHSKHIFVSDDQIIDIKTYMTGEFFELLSQKSILRLSVENNYGQANPQNLTSFKMGVNDAIDANLLNAAFKVRTNNLFNKLSNRENYDYLSGLLIGTELKELNTSAIKKISLVGGSNLSEYYRCALAELGLLSRMRKVNATWADEAVVRGQYKIYKTIMQ